MWTPASSKQTETQRTPRHTQRRLLVVAVGLLYAVQQPCARMHVIDQIPLPRRNGIWAYVHNQTHQGVSTGVLGIYTPKISPSKLFMGYKWRQNGYWTWVLKFYTSPKNLYPQYKFLATPLKHTAVLVISSYRRNAWPSRFISVQYTPPTRLNCRRCVPSLNLQLAHDNCRRIRSTIWKLKMLRIYPVGGVIDIDNFLRQINFDWLIEQLSH